MAYYHVLLTFREAHTDPRCMLTDLSEDQLRAQFLIPYRRGKDVLWDNEVVEVSRINKVTIVRTADTSTNELKRLQKKSWNEIDQLNRTSNSLVFLGPGRGYKLEDIVEVGDDVTSIHILGPPGYGDTWSVVTAVVNQPWVLAVGTGLIVAALVWWLGLN